MAMIKNKKIPAPAEIIEEPPLLNQKSDLATRAIDLLMFGGDTGKMLGPLAAMVGLPEISISLIFPTKRPDNMRPFLALVNLIISTVLDDQVELPDFTAQLADAIQKIKVIAQEDK